MSFGRCVRTADEGDPHALGLDRSQAMLEAAGSRVSGRVRADGTSLPFRDDGVERIFTGHFYGHLRNPERTRFLREARRVARDLVVLDAVRREGVPAEEMQTRVLSDGSTHQVYKRFFTARSLLDELGGEGRCTKVDGSCWSRRLGERATGGLGFGDGSRGGGGVGDGRRAR